MTTGSGKGKSAYSYLVSIPEEKRMVQRLYTLFRTNRSIQKTAKQMNLEGYRTSSGAEFNTSTTRLVLRNPIYCTADRCSYDYFIDHEGNVFGDLLDFDGQHGLSAYNKTDQEKFEDSERFKEILEIKIEEVLVTLIQTIVERIYIVDKDDERFCHIFIKGCTDEDYTGFFQTAGYIEPKTTPVCDSEQYCIHTKAQTKNNL